MQSIFTPVIQGFQFLRQRRFSIEDMDGRCKRSTPTSPKIRFATSSKCPRSLQRRQEWLEDIKREDAGRALVNGVAVTSMMSKRIRRIKSPP